MDGCVLLTSTPECVVSPRGETTHSGVDVNNTHPSMINPLIINLNHYHIFPWLCTWDVCYIIFCHLLHIHSGNTGFCFHYYCAVYNVCKYSDTFWLADRVHLFVHYSISLSSLCKLIWGHWTYKMPVGYILSSVRVRLSIFSQLSIIQYMGLCVFSLPISLVMVERIYTLSYYHHKIGSMNFYSWFRVRSWNNGMPCMSLYILMNVVQYNGKGKYVENRKTSRGAMNQEMIKNCYFRYLFNEIGDPYLDLFSTLSTVLFQTIMNRM